MRRVVHARRVLLVNSLKSGDQIACEWKERPSGVDLQQCEVVEGNFRTAFKLIVSSEASVDCRSQFRLSNIENVFDEGFDCFDVRYVVGSVSKQQLRDYHETLAGHLCEVSKTIILFGENIRSLRRESQLTVRVSQLLSDLPVDPDPSRRAVQFDTFVASSCELQATKAHTSEDQLEMDLKQVKRKCKQNKFTKNLKSHRSCSRSD